MKAPGSEPDGAKEVIEEKPTPPPHLNPGSDAAIEAGCLCPVLDNGHGKGRGGDGEQFGWWISENCPIHCPEWKDEKTADE